MRTLQVTGHLVADAEKKMSKSGKEYLSFRIANNEFGDEKGADGKQKPYWISVTTFNQRFFGIAQYLTKGKGIIVDGDYSDNLYQDKDGNCQISRNIIANAIYFNNASGDGQGKTVNNTTNQTRVATQTKMEAPKLTTAELKVPTQSVSATEYDDELPF